MRTVSKRNSTFQYWQTLVGNRTKRQRAAEMIVQGVRPISLALRSGLSLSAVLIRRGPRRSSWAESTIAAAERAGARLFLVEAELMKELGEKDDEAPEVLLVVQMPPDDLSRIPLAADSLVVALDRPASPGNLGSIVRSADALGAHGVVITGHAADPYDPKALRASTGSTLMMPTVRLPGPGSVLDWVEAVRAEGTDMQIIGTDESAQQHLWDIDLRGPTLVVTGNEHAGMSAAWRQACDALTQIPMVGHASSLNAANATSVLLYEATRQRRSTR